MATLLLADHDNQSIKDTTARALSAAVALGAPVTILVAGHNARAAADAAAASDASPAETEQEAAAKAAAEAAKAEAEAAASQSAAQPEAEAEKRRLEAQGEASAIFARLEAEARGQYEILAKKGEGLKEIIQACGGTIGVSPTPRTRKSTIHSGRCRTRCGSTDRKSVV